MTEATNGQSPGRARPISPGLARQKDLECKFGFKFWHVRQIKRPDPISSDLGLERSCQTFTRARGEETQRGMIRVRPQMRNLFFPISLCCKKRTKKKKSSIPPLVSE